MNAATSVTAPSSSDSGPPTSSPPRSRCRRARSSAERPRAWTADDDAYLVVNAAKTTPRTATWFGAFTGMSNATTTLKAT